MATQTSLEDTTVRLVAEAMTFTSVLQPVANLPPPRSAATEPYGAGRRWVTIPNCASRCHSSPGVLDLSESEAHTCLNGFGRLVLVTCTAPARASRRHKEGNHFPFAACRDREVSD